MNPDMEIEVVPITIDGSEQCKVRLDGTLYGVFWSNEEAMEYAESLKFNLPGDLSDPKNP